MARTKRIWRESQHPRDAKGRFSRRGGAAWAKRAAAEIAAQPGSADTRSAAGRPRISRQAKAGVTIQSHLDGGRPSPVRVPQAVKTAAPKVDLTGFMAKGLPTPVKRAAPPVKNLAAFNAPDAPRRDKRAVAASIMDRAKTEPVGTVLATGRREASNTNIRLVVAERDGRRHVMQQTQDKGTAKDWDDQGRSYNADDLRASMRNQSENTGVVWSETAPEAPKRTPRAAPGAAALIAARAEEQAPQQAAMTAARTAPESAPVNGAEAYAAMRRHTLLALARDAGIGIRGKTNTEIANELAAHDAKVKADRAAKLNPSGVGARVDTPRANSQDGGMTSTTSDEPRNLVTMARTMGLAMPQGATAVDYARAANNLARNGKLDAAEVELQNGTRSGGITPADVKALNGILQALKDVRAGRQTLPADQDQGRMQRNAAAARLGIEPERDNAQFDKRPAYLDDIEDRQREQEAREAAEAAKAAPGADTEHLKRPKAKKGDLVVVERQTSSYTIGKGHEEGTEVTVGIVTSTDRDGRVTGYSTNADGSYPGKVGPREKTYKLEQERVDVQAAMEAARAHTYPNSDTPRPYASLAEARAAVAPHLGDQSASVKAKNADARAAAKRRPASEAKVTEAATAMREKDYDKALRLIDEGEAADPGYKDKQGRGWGDFRTFVTARRDQVAKQEAERKAEEAGPKESAADLAAGRELYQRFASPDRTPFDYAPSHAVRDAAEQRARDEVASILPSSAIIFGRDTLASRLARAEGAVAAFTHQREAKRAEVVAARALIAKIEDPEYRKLQEKEILRRLEFEEETLISAIHRQETDAAAARADLEKALGRGADREKLLARRRSDAEDRARTIANGGGRGYGDSGAGARVIARFGTRPSSADLKAMSDRDRQDAQNELIMRGSHQDDLSKIVRSSLRNVDTAALTPEQRQAWIDATDAPTRAVVHTLAARQRRDLALSRLAALEAHEDRPSDAPELRSEIDKAIAQERANLDFAQSELAELEPEYDANLSRIEAAVNDVRDAAGLKAAKLNTKALGPAYAKRITSAGITPQANPPAPPAPSTRSKLVFAPRTPTTNRKQIPRDTKLRAMENERDGGRGVVARHRALTRAEFDALPEAERTRVLQDLRQVARSKEEESYTIPSNRSSMGMTVRGMREAAHVTAAREKLRELTYTAPPPVDNSAKGRAERLKAGDRWALEGATMADLDEIGRAAGYGGIVQSWKRQKAVDYLRNRAAAGDRLPLRQGGPEGLAEALRGATPGQALAILDVIEADRGVTLAEMKAVAKILGGKLPAGDKRRTMHNLAALAKDAPPKADAAPVAAPARSRISPDAKRGALDKANADATAAKRAASLEKARQAQRDERRALLNRTKDPKDNSAKIKALEDGTLDSADLYRTAMAGPSGQRAPVHVGRVRHTPDRPEGEFEVTSTNGGDRAGWATRVSRNGETVYAVHSENADGGTELLGWADTLAHAADVLTNGETAASTGGTLDARRISGRLFERNPSRGMSLDELELSAARDAVRRAREDAENPNLIPAARERARRELTRREADLQELIAERSGERQRASLDTPRVKSQNGGMTTTQNAPALPKSKLAHSQDARLRAIVAIEAEIGPAPRPPFPFPRRALTEDEIEAMAPWREAVQAWRQRARQIADEHGANSYSTAGDAGSKLIEKGLMGPYVSGEELATITDEARRLVASTSPTPKPVKKAPATGNVAPVGDRPRTGTYTGDIQANRAERFNNKALTDHVRTLVLTVPGDAAESIGYGDSDEPVQVGDEVFVFTFNKWRRGIVTATTRGGTNDGTTRVMYSTPTGDNTVMETTNRTEGILRLIDPSLRPGTNRAALLPRIAPEARPRRMSEEDKAAAKEARKEAEKVAAAKRRQDFFNEKIDRVTQSLNGTGDYGTQAPEWHLQMTTEEGLVSLAKHLGVKVPNREKSAMGYPKPRDRDKLVASIVEAIKARRDAEGKA